jgi:hypothetical protein
VHYNDGNFYPAGIYLGGSAETIVHAIDSQVIDLMNRAEASSNGGANNSGGGIVQVNEGVSGAASFAVGSVNVTLTPAGAVSEGAYWEIGDGVKRASGESALGLAPGEYTVQFFAGEGIGYSAPASTTVSVTAGGVTPATGTYTPNAPTITSATEVTAIEGQPFSYQLTVTPGIATSYSVVNSLPAGLTLDGSTGLISGVVPIGTAAGISSIMLQPTNGKGAGSLFGLTVNVAPPGELTVSISGKGTVSKGFSEPVVEAVGSLVTIKASPASGSVFESWSDADTGDVLTTGETYTFTMPPVLDLEANFAPNPFLTAKGSYLALLQGGTYAYSGFAQLTVSSNGSFTATYNLGGSTAKIHNIFDNQGGYQGGFALPDGTSFTEGLKLTSGGILSGTITSVTDGTQIPLDAERTAAQADASLEGSYTVVLPAVSGAGLPAGNGYGTVTVSKTGTVKFTGQLGDGVPVTISGALDSSGVWPFLFTKAAGSTTGAEMLLGSVAFPPATGGTAGTLDWYRTPDALYPAGFSIMIPLLTSRYAQPAVSATGAEVTFGGAMPVSVSISAKDVVTTSGTSPLTLKFTQKTGLFTGKFEDNGNLLPFAGAVLQSGSFGMGLFKDANGETSPVLLEEAQ